MRKEDLNDGRERFGSMVTSRTTNNKKNLEKFGKQVTFNRGYIPEVFKNSDNPNEILGYT